MTKMVQFLKNLFKSKLQYSQIKKEIPSVNYAPNPPSLEDHIKYADNLKLSGLSNIQIQTAWQIYFNQLDEKQQKLVWKHANSIFPRIYSLKSQKAQKLINKLWSKIFYNENNLHQIAGQCPLRTQKGEGLVYCYLINGQVRYVGQTRENSLRWRMTKKQKDGKVGYNYAIKRRLVNAYRDGSFTIWTRKMPVAKLDTFEKALIQRYAPYHKLWNIEHNEKHFEVTNYSS